MELGAITYDNLFAGNVADVVTGPETITGGNYTKGTVLGRITASGKLTVVNSANTDGSQTPYAVLADDTDASAVDVESPVYYTGEFNEDKLVFGGTDTKDTHRAALRNIGIFLKTTVKE